MLEEDIKIYSKLPNIKDHIVLSSGSYFVDIPEACHGYSYKGYAPLEPWCSLTAEEALILLSPLLPQENHNSIGIGQISKDLLDTSRSLNIENISSEKEIHHLNQKDEFKSFVSALLSYFESNIIQEEGFAGPVIAFRFPNDLKTATTDKYRKTYMGLHMDSWDTYPWRLRHLARNRICINLGKEMRYFLCVNLTAQRLIHAIEAQTKCTLESLEEPLYLPHVFLKTFPQYKVIKIGLKPGEYYIAPTENMIHDSTVLGKTSSDVSLTFWGHFRSSGR